MEAVDAEHDFVDLLSYSVLPMKILKMLGWHLVYTGPGVPLERSKTIKAHLIAPGTTADDLAGRLHGAIHKGFLRAEVISAPLLLHYSSFATAKADGVVRTEGREYRLQADDVILIKWKG